MGKREYSRFFLMIATSMIFMFCVMYLNSFERGHVRWSETRFYMTLLMGATMAVVMLSFMRAMYKNRRKNLMIYGLSFVAFAAALWLVRSQRTVQDASWMKAMIPHHSIAILTSERAQIVDPRVRELADQIIRSQRKEIKEMNWLIEDIKQNGIARSEEEARKREVPIYTGSE